jgi:iron complex outermembrane recepter protein
VVSFRHQAGEAPKSVPADSRSIGSPVPRLIASAVALALGLGVTGYAQAQEGEARGEGAASLDEVTVTGTRIKQRADYVSPNPITTIDATDLQRLGIINVADAMTAVPQNVSQFTPANTGGSAFFVGSTLANLRGLNPFFGTRTLTLVDSHRFIPTTQGDSVDLNFIPSNLIARTEIVTGGASAAYGSGAISGVVNILLDHQLQGIKLDADYSQTERGDGGNAHFGLAGGTEFAGGRGHFIIGGEYQKSDVIQDCSAVRDWCRKSIGAYSNDSGLTFAAQVPYTQKEADQPWNIITENVRENQLSPNGVIFNNTVGATSTFAINDAGTDIVPFAVGRQGFRTTGGNTVGGDGVSIYKNLSLYPDVKRKTAYSRLGWDLTDSLKSYVELSFGQVEAANHQWTPFANSANTCIRPDNGYLAGVSTAMRDAILARDGNAAFGIFPNGFCSGFFGAPGTIIKKDWRLQNDQTVTTDTKVTRAVLGFSGAFGSSSWTWDAYYQYGKTTRDQIGHGYRTNWRYTFATDAVVDNRVGSATNGQIICRVTRDGVSPGQIASGADPSLATGCRPLNIFGISTASPEALAYAFGDLDEHDNIKQDVLAASVSGEVWDGWGAGPLAAAFGIEGRKDKLDNIAADIPFAQRTDFPLQYGDSFGGVTKVTEGFLELEMPLLKDVPGAKIASLNGAVRKAHYKNEGGLGTSGQTGTQDITSWKGAAVWDPIDWLRIRGSRSRDLRAASFRELYYSQSIPPGGIFGSVTNPWIVVDPPGTPGGIQDQRDSTTIILSGNPTLAPEVGNTTTVGFVVSPTTNMHFSADWYQIKIIGGQALEASPTIPGLCFNGTDPSKCNQLVFGPPLPGKDPNSNITSVRANYVNLRPYKTQGVDFAFDYNMPLTNLFESAKGNLLFRLSGTWAMETLTQLSATAPVHDIAGQTGGDQGFLSDFAAAPSFTGTLTTTYLNGPLTLTMQNRYVSSGRLDQQNPKLGPGEAGFANNLSYTTTDPDVGSYFITDLTGSYDFQWFGLENVNMYASISNVMDRDPPFSAGAVGGANAIYFDTLGRSYRLGMRVRF